MDAIIEDSFSRPLLTALDLFAGAGGATQGLKDAGFSVLGAVENDEAAATSYCQNHDTPLVVIRDIRRVTPAWLEVSMNLDKGPLDLLNACPPCQGWSSLGKRNDADVRNDLIGDVWRMVEQLKPRSWVLENVTGLAGDPRLDGFVKNAKEAGYGVRSYRLNAKDFGVPQRRKRLIVIGIHGRASNTIPEDLLATIPPKFDRQSCTAGEALERGKAELRAEDTLNIGRRHRNHTVQRISAVPIGGNRFDLPVEHQLECHQRMKSRQASASYGRIQADKPAPTMTTRCTTPACGSFIHPTENRGITLREAALIQSFPKDYNFFGNYGQIEAQIGNAFPPRMAEGVGLAIKTLLDEGFSDAITSGR